MKVPAGLSAGVKASIYDIHQPWSKTLDLRVNDLLYLPFIDIISIPGFLLLMCGRHAGF